MLQMSRRLFLLLLLAVGACASLPPGINQGVPGVATGKLLLPAGPLRAVPARFNDEAIAVQNWPAKEGHIVFVEFHY